jgi:hypothetical protein
MDKGDNVASIACVEHFEDTQATLDIAPSVINGTSNGKAPTEGA